MHARDLPFRTAGSRFPGLVLLALALWALPAAVPCAAVVLTDLEQAYIQDHPEITLCVDPDWVPFESINEEGRHEGIAADLLRLVAARTGLRLRLVPTVDWDDSLAASRDGRCQLVSFLNRTPQREAWLLFSEPLFTDTNVFITREPHPFISDPGGLEGETIVLPRGTAMAASRLAARSASIIGTLPCDAAGRLRPSAALTTFPQSGQNLKSPLFSFVFSQTHGRPLAKAIYEKALKFRL